jgi:hypothetical protein
MSHKPLIKQNRSKIFEMSWRLSSTNPPPPSSAITRPPPAYITTTTTSMGSLFIVCCLVFTSAMEVGAAAVAVAGVIKARSLILAIEREGSKPSFDTLGQWDSAA